MTVDPQNTNQATPATGWFSSGLATLTNLATTGANVYKTVSDTTSSKTATPPVAPSVTANKTQVQTQGQGNSSMVKWAIGGTIALVAIVIGIVVWKKEG